ncbi:zinc-dependent alcohol dehydrogenase family protein [Aeromicrobium sp.]|uniref:zinc-dependent alcohol dehydrogenase family protein n=1 Tax=Aeromicrobium sp. TaxID=1871063 RepID=UPI00199AA491|nr:zinc-dependent alcohol dehydrogenase family protein [Aeromicrobium sp.]MBC7629921.1 zinc-dependent alcohol dehydrogenase family protein [Aeromicrobium sp.]
MHAVIYERFGEMPEVAEVRDPVCTDDGVVIEVGATGLCRSDWHGWMGHDPGIRLPHVPGHEFAGTIVATGAEVSSWHVGDRVTTPFVCACGTCATCLRGDQQVCERQLQPGFTGWGSFAELVSIERADVNLVHVPDEMELDVAASLGCRFATAYRAVVQLGEVGEGDWVAVHGCGGVGLSAVMVAAARGARVIAVDVARSSLDLALSFGAEVALDASTTDVVQAIVEVTSGGADVSIDALGSTTTMLGSLRCLRRRGRHLQVGLLAGDDDQPRVPMDLVTGSELIILGSHGMAAHSYPQMMAEVSGGMLRPELLVRDHITLDEAPQRLARLGEPGAGAGGVTIIRP